ncbi:hypothetical protein TGGT1_211880 [Toxoplasma gondii GT1]|uniref:Uncharacterized protein n=5 Tax=Toxoplasma gondii TaxID=5811 RepID=B9PWH6_TOXGV|nr:hypothetical protein TGGT1_211880 [Toxoplasma gondii GT1]ESS32286.1 hypothetical protein TGVEG_211880 [Toxoplasma gondii VEG]KAF4640351.1 hypothetical protein TGRH88_042770 [Toxoplasma gondii]KFG31153.1 hypothetical protein TGP89_211880 [Toxoplasma gondii p89]KFH00949.1 hypothetical protein TGMAS_211880 [Toxoplasma gondii MAS]
MNEEYLVTRPASTTRTLRCCPGGLHLFYRCRWMTYDHTTKRWAGRKRNSGFPTITKRCCGALRSSSFYKRLHCSNCSAVESQFLRVCRIPRSPSGSSLRIASSGSSTHPVGHGVASSESFKDFELPLAVIRSLCFLNFTLRNGAPVYQAWTRRNRRFSCCIPRWVISLLLQCRQPGRRTPGVFVP